MRLKGRVAVLMLLLGVAASSCSSKNDETGECWGPVASCGTFTDVVLPNDQDTDYPLDGLIWVEYPYAAVTVQVVGTGLNWPIVEETGLVTAVLPKYTKAFAPVTPWQANTEYSIWIGIEEAARFTTGNANSSNPGAAPTMAFLEAHTSDRSEECKTSLHGMAWVEIPARGPGIWVVEELTGYSKRFSIAAADQQDRLLFYSGQCYSFGWSLARPGDYLTFSLGFLNPAGQFSGWSATEYIKVPEPTYDWEYPWANP